MFNDKVTFNNYLDEDIRPYEKCIKYGEGALTDSELLAAIIRTGVVGKSATELSEAIFEQFAGEHQGITHLLDTSVEELMTIKGIGKAKAVQIRCICELSKRIAKKNSRIKLDFSSSQSVAQYYMDDLRSLSKEQLLLVMLDSKCCLIRDAVVSIGTVNSSLVSPREIFIEALKYRAVFIIMLHNHPSGDPSPSTNDLIVTERIKKTGDIIGIHLLDHIIIGDNSYVSLKEQQYI